MGCAYGFSCGTGSYSETNSVNPDPKNFKIIKTEITQFDTTIMLVNYPNCTTFGGNKLLLLKGLWNTINL